MDIAPVGPQIEDWIADELTGAVIGDIAAAARLEHVDAAGGQNISRGENVRAAAIAAYAERQHMRVLEQQQRIGDAPGAAIFDERTLKVERLAIRHRSETADVENPRGDAWHAHPTITGLYSSLRA